MNWFRCKLHPLKNHRVLAVLDQFIRQIVGYDIRCDHIDGVALYNLFENAIPRIRAQMPLNSNHDPPLYHHRWKTTRSGINESNTILIFSHSLQCAAQWKGLVCCNSLHSPTFWTTVGSAKEYEEIKNFHTSAQLDSPVNEKTSARIDNASVSDHTKVDYFAWNRQCYELFQTPIAA